MARTTGSRRRSSLLRCGRLEGALSNSAEGGAAAAAWTPTGLFRWTAELHLAESERQENVVVKPSPPRRVAAASPQHETYVYATAH